MTNSLIDGIPLNKYSVIRRNGKDNISQTLEIMAKNPFDAMIKAKVLFKGKSHPKDKYEIGEDFI